MMRWDLFHTMMGLTTSVFLILVLVSQFGLSIQACNECSCCKGSHNCNTNKNCVIGCIDGYYGSKCTDECLDNCKTCFNGYECTECKPGYYTNKCNLQCGKGCLNNTCSLALGECKCKSTYFTARKCDACLGLKYGEECNKTCPTDCGTCTSETECSWCKNRVYYGSYCQYRCSVNCVGGTCNKGNGNCEKGCKPNYIGDKCDTCSPGIYGTFCDLNCTENCLACVSPTNCTECNTGYYGDKCTSTCPSGCNGNCSLSDGRCEECKPGFIGEFCEKCKDGIYGVNCSKLCNDIDKKCQVCASSEPDNYWNCTACEIGFYPVFLFGKMNSTCKSCPNYCSGNICDTPGICTNGCVQGKWGQNCSNNCGTNCVVCSQSDGKCFECTNDTFSGDCSQNCSTNCNFTDNGRICERDTGGCLQGCKSTITYGEYCEKLCSNTCNNQSCDWKTGHCSDGCSINHHGPFCDKTCSTSCMSNESKRVCDDVKGNCFYGCKDGFYGEKCDYKCSIQCVNATCNQETAECLHGCVDGFEGLECFLAIKGADLEEKKPLLIASSAGAGVTVIVLLVILVICLIKWNRRQKLPSNTKCEENDYVLDMKEIPKQIDEDEPGVIYAKPFKPKQEAGGDVGKEYDTAYDGDKKIPALDNGYTAVNIGTSANAKGMSFEVCDIAHDNKCNKPLTGNSDYAVIKKGKSTVKENECIEEMYDTTHDNKKNKGHFNSSNDYALLSVRSDSTKGFGKSNLAQPDDVYDSAEGGKHKTMSHPSNDYAVFNSNNGDSHGNDKANTLYDTATDKKMRPGNNDYDFCELNKYLFHTIMGLTTSVFLILVLVSQFGLSIQACDECRCCKGGTYFCDSNSICLDGCIDGYYGNTCTEECLENCKTCVTGYECGECKPGYYTKKCNLQCGKGCLNRTCSHVSGECSCKSANFVKGKCDVCVGLMYGNECNNTCPTNCGSCISDAECSWCRNTAYYESYCQYRCSVGCVNGTCNKGTGHCTKGCKPGFIGGKCEKCSPGIYGPYCDLNCTDNCFNCVSLTNCTECKTGFYGNICNNTCPSGCNGNCSLADGRCLQCKSGFVGDLCDTCENGSFGVNCSKSCRDEDINCRACIANELDSYGNCTECDDGFYLNDQNNLGLNIICTNCSYNCKNSSCNVAGRCKYGCLHGKWGEYCEKYCSDTCNKQSCDWKSGNCSDGCSINYYGPFCDQNCSTSCLSNGNKRVCDEKIGYCLYRCKDGFHGEKCENKCSSQCVNAICDKDTAECLHGCTYRYEGPKCVLAIKDAESEEKTSYVIIAASAGAGVAVIVLLVIPAICLIKRNRRQKLSAQTKCEENDYVLDMKEIPKQIDDDESGVVYAKPLQNPKQEAGGDAGKEHDTAYDGDKNIPAIDNGYSTVNIGTSANVKGKSFEVCDIAHDNKCNKPLNGNNDYAVVKKGKSTVKENECIEEMYDTTRDNKKNKDHFDSNNDYAVLSVRSDNTESKLTQPDDVYDSADGEKHKTMSPPSNDYAVFNSNNLNKHGNDKANTLYDTKSDKKMRPVNNDYDFCELDND
ncbi:cell death abnormality protein 1-like [Ruditapes philippinarum]|uniref:cell death abnormality protein 1-like n=1 Tax=Ruditapes philippinarum TaxID=129788 RepID=UPI00295A9D20|nr:cell death abnormality protein 1-like [Ruditapes philippinarum]